MLTITHSLDEGTLLDGTSKGDGTNAIVKQFRFKWSGKIAQWYVPQSRGKVGDRYRIERAAEALRAAGFEVTVTIDNELTDVAEREAARDERSIERAENLGLRAERKMGESTAAHERSRAILDPIPFGQPILVGHHSEGRHRAALRRADQAMQRASNAHGEAQDAQLRAEGTVRAARNRHTPTYLGNRIAEREADIRRYERVLAGTQGYGHRPASGTFKEDTEARLAQAREELAYYHAQLAELAANGRKIFTRADFKRGDMAKVRGSWRKVVRVNAKSLSLDSGYSWTNLYPYTEIQDRRDPPAEEEQ